MSIQNSFPNQTIQIFKSYEVNNKSLLILTRIKIKRKNISEMTYFMWLS